MNKKKITIGLPIYISDPLHAEFTEKTVESIKTSHDRQLVIINNFCKPEFLPRMKKLSTLFFSTKENNVSAAWNTAIRQGISNKSDYILIPNNDLILHHKCIDNLVKFAEEHPEFIMWTASEWIDIRTISGVKEGDIKQTFDEHPHFSCFMVSPKTIELLKNKEEGTKEPYPGMFDENFKPAYFEDGDMHNRILRAGYKAAKTASALFYHFGSRTIKIDRHLHNKNSKTYEKCREYYKEKWGWDPHNSVVDSASKIRFKYKEPFKQ